MCGAVAWEGTPEKSTGGERLFRCEACGILATEAFISDMHNEGTSPETWFDPTVTCPECGAELVPRGDAGGVFCPGCGKEPF